jgi:hypothetical protein
MPRILFTADHDYRHPKFPQTTAYKKGHKLLASQHLADEAVRLGKAELLKSKAVDGAEPGSEAPDTPEA